jgi:hypothetical protein
MTGNATDNHVNTRLDSWKEISVYLGRGIRTLQRWEIKMGLPIHRFPELSRSRVFAYKNDIDAWLKETGQTRENIKKTKGLLGRPVKHPLLIVSALILTGILFFIGFTNSWSFGSSPVPADFSLSGSTLSILNGSGKALWSHDFKIPHLEGEAHYRQRFQIKLSTEEDYLLPGIIMKDINNDGRIETLFALFKDDNVDENRVVCFNHKGEILWDYQVGLQDATGRVSAQNDFFLLGMDVADLDGDKLYETIILSNFREVYPGRVDIIGIQGKPMGIYTHSGHLENFTTADIDQDGFPDILVAGKNEENGSPCCLVLDRGSLFCDSTAEREIRCSEAGCDPPGKCYMLMPVSAALQVCGKHCTVMDITVTERPDRMYDFMGMIGYKFNAQMMLVDIIFSQRFRMEYQKKRRDGLVTDDLTKIRKDLIAEGVRYYKGSRVLSSSPFLGTDRQP